MGVREGYGRMGSPHMNEIKVHDVKLPKNQQRNSVNFFLKKQSKILKEMLSGN